MRLLTFILCFMISNQFIAQMDIIKLFKSFTKTQNELNIVNVSHVRKDYSTSYDDKSDLVLEEDGNIYNFVLSGIDTVIVSQNEKMITSTSIDTEGANTQMVTSFSFNDNGAITRKSIRFDESSGLAELMDEDMMFFYDEKQRLTSITNVKPNIGSTMEIARFVYGEDIFPDSIYADILIKMNISKSLEEDTLIFTMVAQMPTDFMALFGNINQGEDDENQLTEAQKLEMNKMFGKQKQEYCKIHKDGYNNYVQRSFKENNEGTIELVNTSLYDGQFNLLSSESHADNFSSTLSYTYHTDGRINTLSMNEEVYTYIYDDKKRVLTEYNEDMSKTVYSYEEDRLVEVRKYYFDTLTSVYQISFL